MYSSADHFDMNIVSIRLPSSFALFRTLSRTKSLYCFCSYKTTAWFCSGGTDTMCLIQVFTLHRDLQNEKRGRSSL